MTDSIFDDPRSRESEGLAFRAETLDRRGCCDEARQLYTRAAELEEAVVAEVPASAPRIKHVLALSAIALWIKADNHERSTALATKYVADGILTEEDLGDMVDLQLAEMLRNDRSAEP